MKEIFTTVICALAMTASAATLRCGDGRLSYSDNTPWSGDITIEFAPCMANELFTFSKVSMDGKVLNLTGSDNIGPFMLAGGWSGGNHLNDGKRSAYTESVEVSADGKPVDIEKRDSLTCRAIEIKVVNRLLMPADTLGFATETITYTVAGNSVEVNAEHRYTCEKPVIINRYYGMQSMFIDETEILTPGGRYGRWTPIGEVDRFAKSTAPAFDTFIEHSPRGYQAAWMDRDTGLGDRNMIVDDDWVYIGNSYSKAYHKLIGDRTVANGDTTRWHGVYTWFEAPVSDNCRAGETGGYSYGGYLGGEPTLFYIDHNGRTTTTKLK